MSLEYPASGEKQDRLESVLVRNSGHVDDDVQHSALDVLRDGWAKESLHQRMFWIGIEKKMPGDLRRSELSVLVESLTALNALEEKGWKS